jgi:intracellular sulfur oxidation DsrE/DsrF family protein
MFETAFPTSRRSALAGLGTMAATAAAATIAAPGLAHADGLPATGQALAALSRRLAALPRRRAFDRVPFLVDRPALWDHEAAAALLAYRAGPRQMWENSDLGSAWLNLMREAMNGQVFAHGHGDFLPVSATHGSAHLPLFNQAMWDKYGLAERSGGLATSNRFVAARPGTSPSDDRQDLHGFYGPDNNTIAALQRRGAVFIACHDTVHATARAVQAKLPGSDPDRIAADLTNNLIPGVILVPSVVAFIAELQGAGYSYAKGA